MFNYTDDIWRMATTCTFCVVSVDCSIFERCDGGLDKARFVKRVGVDEALDVKFIANC